MTSPTELIADIVGFAFVDGVWRPGLMAARAAHDLEALNAPWLHAIAEAVFEHSPVAMTEVDHDLHQFISARLQTAADTANADPVLGWIRNPSDLSPDRWSPPVLFRPHIDQMGSRRWPVAEIDTPGHLASILGLGPSELDWYADLKGLERHVSSIKLRHYDYHLYRKRSGGQRLVEAPKQNLKGFQRWILRSILDEVPAHHAAHGFRRGRSIQTYVATHTAQDVVLRMDLRSFFTSVPAARVRRTFEALGYTAPVARTLTGLTTNSVPREFMPEDADTRRLRFPHLPQGSPTSPSLANLVCYGLDQRLQALANVFALRYTRYADDLAFSGNRLSPETIGRFGDRVARIVDDEGFSVNDSKTRLRKSNERQVLAGLVVNQHANVHRRDYDRLKAVLHDAAVNGPEVANRDGHPQFRSHLEGRIGFVQATNRNRAFRLWALFDRIDW